jgi:enediyne biosynthesis protein E4
MDLFVASGPGGSAGFDFCYKNLKKESGLDTLQLMTTELFATQQQDGQCYNFIDADNDGDLDLCLTNYGGAQTRFYENSNGTYLSHLTPFTTTAQNLSNCWGDYDNDGDLDVVITADALASKLYFNNGSLSFAPAISIGVSSSGVSNADYDNDGDLDLFFHGQNTGRALFKYTAASGNNWVNIKCKGLSSNNSAIGTIVKLKATISGMAVWQTREINAQNSFQSQNDLRVHFGLGNAAVIDSIIFNFSSGQTDVVTNVTVNQFYCHDEGSSNLCLLIGVKELNKNQNFSIFPNPAEQFISIQSKNPSQAIESWSISDEHGRILLSSQQKSIGLLRIDVQKLLAGNYQLTLVSEKKTSSLTFVKL